MQQRAASVHKLRGRLSRLNPVCTVLPVSPALTRCCLSFPGPLAIRQENSAGVHHDCKRPAKTGGLSVLLCVLKPAEFANALKVGDEEGNGEGKASDPVQ